MVLGTPWGHVIEQSTRVASHTYADDWYVLANRFSIEPELIVAIPPELAKAIIQNRGWIFPLPPREAERIRAENKKTT